MKFVITLHSIDDKEKAAVETPESCYDQPMDAFMIVDVADFPSKLAVLWQVNNEEATL